MKTIKTDGAPKPIGPYSQAIESDGFLFLSGQIGLDPGTGELGGDIRQQTYQVMKNINAVVEAGGCTLKNIVKTTIYLKSISDFAEVNSVYSEYFAENPPARTTIEVSSLPRNALIEIEVIANR